MTKVGVGVCPLPLFRFRAKDITAQQRPLQPTAVEAPSPPPPHPPRKDRSGPLLRPRTRRRLGAHVLHGLSADWKVGNPTLSTNYVHNQLPLHLDSFDDPSVVRLAHLALSKQLFDNTVEIALGRINTSGTFARLRSS